MAISVIGCGRWGSFLAYYLAKHRKQNILLYGRENSSNFLELITYNKNKYLELPACVSLTSNLENAITSSSVIFISIGCQSLRNFLEEINRYDLNNKTFVLAMKGLELHSQKRMTQVFNEEIKGYNGTKISVLLGPGHVQDYIKGIPSCAVVDSDDESVKSDISSLLNSSIMRVYKGNDLIGNEIGAALKNVIGLAAGILDGLEWSGLKGALMARATVEVSRIIGHFGGDKMSAYGLCHLGDYEATLFSKHSNNRLYGENFVRNIPTDKLAEGVATLESVYALREQIDIPICSTLYKVIKCKSDIREEIGNLFDRPIKNEF